MRAKRVTQRSTSERLECASPTMRMILASTESVAGFVACTIRVPSPLTVPAKTCEPGSFGTSALSPVMGA